MAQPKPRKKEPPEKNDTVVFTCISHFGHRDHVTWTARRDDSNGNKCPVCRS